MNRQLAEGVDLTLVSGLSVREYQPSDQPGFAEFSQSITEEAGFAQGSQLDVYPDDPTKSHLKTWVLAGPESRILGAVELSQVNEEDVEVRQIGVDPTIRRQGFGRKLLEAALEWSYEAGFLRVRSAVSERQFAALILFIHSDFEHTALIEGPEQPETLYYCLDMSVLRPNTQALRDELDALNAKYTERFKSLQKQWDERIRNTFPNGTPTQQNLGAGE